MATKRRLVTACKARLADLAAYVDGDLDAARCAAVDQHCEQCDDCRVVVDTLRKTVALYRQLPPPSLPNNFHKRLRAALYQLDQPVTDGPRNEA